MGRLTAMLYGLISGMEGKPLATTEAYDCKTNTWHKLKDMGTCHCSSAFTVFQNQLLVIGGLAIGGPTDVIDALSCV